ncbi:hypothetical protein [Streptomyces sp. SID13031]|uniref:hypothetical protein n=1 Tax=Streptomyces sp. SID13031 TaxID=2706046 RepID=UPI0013C6B2DA|nr:hypothetical protein [Streptomyces sp. SID13031]NEA36365.1 hypothetical protein [Streptomyces sp. SID13031]
MITSLEGLLERHAWAALRISGADQSSWSGEIVEAGDGILGLAHWDGTLHLDRESILEPLSELYDRPGEPRSDAELSRCREALMTLLHEQSHFLGPAGATQEAARAAFELPGGRALEEGVAEVWAHDHLNDYIRELGIDKVAPGILHAHSEPSYAAFVPAVRLFSADLDRQTGSPAGQSLHLLNRQTAEGQWPQAVALIYQSSRLPHLVPPDQAPAVRLHLEQALRTSFKGLELYEPFPRGFAASRSHAATTRTLSFLHQELATAERHYTPTPTRTRIHLTPPRLPAPPSPVTNTPMPTPSPASADTSAPAHRLRPTDSHQAALHAFAGISPPTHRAPSPPTAPPPTTPTAVPATAKEMEP